MIIQDLVQNSTLRTFVGLFNTTSNGYFIKLQFRIIDQNHQIIDDSFTKTFPLWKFNAFNPLAEAGIDSGSYDDGWLYIHVVSSQSSGPRRGLFYKKSLLKLRYF